MNVELTREDGTIRTIENVGGCTTGENGLTIIMMDKSKLNFDIEDGFLIDTETQEKYIKMREVIERSF